LLAFVCIILQEYPQETVVYLDPNSGDPLYGCDRVTECTNATSTVTKFVEELKLFRQLRVAQLHPKAREPRTPALSPHSYNSVSIGSIVFSASTYIKTPPLKENLRLAVNIICIFYN
jgi:hypothetical protein